MNHKYKNLNFFSPPPKVGDLGQTGFDFDIYFGAGAYVCGEEATPINSFMIKVRFSPDLFPSINILIITISSNLIIRS